MFSVLFGLAGEHVTNGDYSHSDDAGDRANERGNRREHSVSTKLRLQR